MNRKNDRPPKRRAAPTKIIDDSAIPEDEEEDELPHEYEEKLLAMIDNSDSSDSEVSSVGSSCEDVKTTSQSEEEKEVLSKPPKKTSKQTRTFKCISSSFIPKNTAPVLEFEEKNCEAASPISAARIITEELRPILTDIVGKKKKSYNFSYFMIIEEGETSKRFGYLATITDEKCLVATHPMKNIVAMLPVTCDQPVDEKLVGIGKRIPIPEQKQVISKKLVPPLSTDSHRVINLNNQEPTQPKKSIKK